MVDDERDAADALGSLLSIWGHQVRVAHAGREALRVGRAFRPEVVVLDLGLPDASGYDVADELRHARETEGVRVIVVSGDSSAIDARRAIELGIDHHLVKPADLRLLRALIEAAEPAGGSVGP